MHPFAQSPGVLSLGGSDVGVEETRYAASRATGAASSAVEYKACIVSVLFLLVSKLFGSGTTVCGASGFFDPHIGPSQG